MLIQDKKKVLFIILFLLAFLSIPAFLNEFWVALITRMMIMGLFALSYNLLFGYSGLLSLGQAAFFGIGAYTSGILLKSVTSSLLVVLLGSMLLGALLALIIGLVTVRLDGIKFAMVTLAFGQMIYTVIYKWRDVTHGDDGFVGIPKPSIAGISVNSTLAYFYLTLFILVIAICLMKIILNSPFGQVMQATRDNQLRVEYLGISYKKVRLNVFMISSVFSAAAGAIYSPLTSIANPDMANWAASADPILMTILGGSSVFWGPLVGSVVYIFIEYVAKTYLTDYWLLIFGSILVLCVMIFPKGILPSLMERLKRAEANKEKSVMQEMQRVEVESDGTA